MGSRTYHGRPHHPERTGIGGLRRRPTQPQHRLDLLLNDRELPPARLSVHRRMGTTDPNDRLNNPGWLRLLRPGLQWHGLVAAVLGLCVLSRCRAVGVLRHAVPPCLRRRVDAPAPGWLGGGKQQVVCPREGPRAQRRLPTIGSAENSPRPSSSVQCIARNAASGQGRDRTGDLPLFRRTLVPTELPGRRRNRVHRLQWTRTRWRPRRDLNPRPPP